MTTQVLIGFRDGSLAACVKPVYNHFKQAFDTQ